MIEQENIRALKGQDNKAFRNGLAASPTQHWARHWLHYNRYIQLTEGSMITTTSNNEL